MVLNFSSWIRQYHPDLQDTIEDTSAVARWLDPNIPDDGVFICARRFPALDSFSEDDFSGRAYASTESFVGYGESGDWEHPDGRIDLRLGPKTCQEDKIRLVAHELRHLGQFHCGWRDSGQLSLLLRHSTCEKDAYAFENVVLDTMARRIVT